MSLFDSSNKGLKFETIGTAHTGTIKSAPRERQQTKFGTQEPDFYPNGDPIMQILVDLQTNQREDANDDGTRTLYVASKNMRRAIASAIQAAGAADILPGGVLTISYIGNDPASKNPANPAKMYAAQYTAPSSAFVAPAAAGAPVAPPLPQAPPAVPQPPAPPFQAAPAVPGGLTEQQQAQAAQLRAAGIAEDVILTAIGATQEQLQNTPF